MVMKRHLFIQAFYGLRPTLDTCKPLRSDQNVQLIVILFENVTRSLHRGQQRAVRLDERKPRVWIQARFLHFGHDRLAGLPGSPHDGDRRVRLGQSERDALSDAVGPAHDQGLLASQVRPCIAPRDLGQRHLAVHKVVGREGHRRKHGHAEDKALNGGWWMVGGSLEGRSARLARMVCQNISVRKESRRRTKTTAAALDSVGWS